MSHEEVAGAAAADATQRKHIAHLIPEPKTNRSFMELLAELSIVDPPEYANIIDKLEAQYGEEGLKNLKYQWELLARPKQLPPKPYEAWRAWCVLAGRGFGKTRTGAEWVRMMVETEQAKRIALVGPTAADVNHVMIGGESGILAISPPWDKPVWSSTNRTLKWKNGAIAETYSAEEPERLRGPQHDAAWCDELAAWRYQYAWDMLMFGLRLGENPQVLVTTTPKPVPVLMDLLKLESTWTTVGTTYENRSNLAKPFFEEVIKKYEGTRLGQQELMAAIMEEVPGALWSYPNLEDNRVKFEDLNKLPEFPLIVLAIDPATTARTSSAETGMCIAAYGSDDHFYILHLDSYKESPENWASRALRLFDQYGCDRLVAEVNNGGDLVQAVIQAINPLQKVYAVHASRGKTTRAEPIAALYEKNRVHHVGTFARAEEQMTQFNPIENPYGLKDMVDALVWAMTTLVEETQGKNIYMPKVGGVRQKLVNYKYR